MKNEPYPFGMGSVRLRFSDHAATAPPILLGTRTLERDNPIHIFADSDVVKTQLEIEIANSRCTDGLVHPTSLVLRAAVSSITFFECVASEHDGKHGVPKVIEHDNWHRIFWTFLQLFESDSGFVANWEDRYTYMRDLWHNEPRYSINDLTVTSLVDDCGKSYSNSSGTTSLEYVDKL